MYFSDTELQSRDRRGWYNMFENNCLFAVKIMSWSSSVSIVSDYRLYDRGLIPGKAKDFSSSFIVQTSSEVHLFPIEWEPELLSRG
jgi:hypothetical protein